MDLWLPQLGFGACHVATWTVFGRVPAVLAILVLVLHARRFAGASKAAVAGSCFLAGVAAGTSAFHGIAGALAGGLLGWELGLRVLGVRLPYAYVAIRTLLVLVGFGRVGCLLAGCCFGTPTDLPWGVAYPAGAFAHHLHADLGWIGAHDLSRPVHPVAAYESVALLLTATLLPALRRRIGSDRALALWVGAAYLLLRAALDPLRGMVNTPGSLVPLGPLSVAQWAYLVASGCLLSAGLYLRRRDAPPFIQDAPAPGKALATWLAAACAFAAFQSTLGPFIAAFSVATFGVAGALLARDVLAEAFGATRLQLAAVAAGLLALVPAGLRASTGVEGGRFWVYAADGDHARLVRIGDQDTPEDALAQKAPAPPPLPLAPPAPRPRVADARPEGRRLTVYGGGGYLRTEQSDGCGGPTSIYRHAQFVGGLALGGETPETPADPRKAWQVDLGVLGESWSERTEPGSSSSDAATYAAGVDLVGTLGAMYHLDWRWVGLGFGGRIGLGSTRTHDRILIPLGGHGFLMPGLYVRLGPPVLGIEIGTGARDQFWPGVFSAVRLGFDTSELRVGWMIWREAPLANAQYYVDARFRLGDRHGLLLRVDLPASGRAATGTVGWSFGF